MATESWSARNCPHHRRDVVHRCDFNGGIETGVYSLNSVGTALDFARLREVPSASQRLILYDEDSEDDGTPTWLLASALVVEHEPFGLAAKVDPDAFTWRPR
jgi:hypothetical protein